MFEDSLLESAGQVQAEKGQTVMVSAIVHILLILVLILIPLIFTDTLEASRLGMMLMAPPPAPAPPRPATTSVQQAVIPRLQPDREAIFAPTVIPEDVIRGVEEAGPPNGVLGGVSGGAGAGVPNGALLSIFQSTVPVAAPPPSPPAPPPPPPAQPPQRIGGDVAMANLIRQVKPVYPPLARAARVEGAVILEATINKVGMIEGVRVVRGHTLLNESAVDAVKQWLYRPLLLNGEPMNVTTTIVVTFSFGN